MSGEYLIKSITIEKKKRKYFDCLVNGSKRAKLLINDISRDFEPGQSIDVEVKDISDVSLYGTVLKYEPLAIIDEEERARRRAAKEAERWLKYAESDARNGLHKTNAIFEALRLGSEHPHLSDRLEALKAQVQKNLDAYEAQKRQWTKEKAERDAKIAERRERRILFPVSKMPEFGKPVRYGFRVIVFDSAGKSFRIPEDAPSIHGHHLLGHEGDYGCYCYYREATEKEIAELERLEAEKQAAEEARKARKQAVERIRKQIIEQGECPVGEHLVDGERLLDHQDAYGGGDWFVITDTDIWYVQNNGADGDDWSRNNVLTGGAGAIGWRMPYNAELVEELRILNNNGRIVDQR